MYLYIFLFCSLLNTAYANLLSKKFSFEIAVLLSAKVVQIGTQYIITFCQNNISNWALVASCGKKLIQIEQVLQIEEKLLQIGAAPVVTNRGNSYYKSGQNSVNTVSTKVFQAINTFDVNCNNFLIISLFLTKSSKNCSIIKNLIVVLLNLAVKSELDIESSCAHLQTQNDNGITNGYFLACFMLQKVFCLFPVPGLHIFAIDYVRENGNHRKF